MKWKCKASGNIIDLPDSESHTMEGHDGYELVVEEVVEVEKPPKQPKTKKEQAE